MKRRVLHIHVISVVIVLLMDYMEVNIRKRNGTSARTAVLI